MSLRLLLDANMSPRTSQLLADRFGYDVESLISRGQGHLSDPEVAALAVEEQRVVLTFDLDFGEIFYRRAHPDLGIIIFRLKDESSPAVNRVVARFFAEHGTTTDFRGTLTVVREDRSRRST